MDVGKKLCDHDVVGRLQWEPRTAQPESDPFVDAMRDWVKGRESGPFNDAMRYWVKGRQKGYPYGSREGHFPRHRLPPTKKRRRRVGILLENCRRVGKSSESRRIAKELSENCRRVGELSENCR